MATHINTHNYKNMEKWIRKQVT